ncbi:hypothetical protein BVRB_033720 [Beta vulgaris subsp. vulgaris]|uniref:Uncharacterized protein n=1 Tax=Beta vulgaris subsp. vulgaris TaxID=3555 RepID=A0A0J8AB53_BETVV|nr:hypothetical protein BVRB_033720 [Beta vulgaris subsp. vulgaris]
MAPSALMYAEFSESIPLNELMTDEALSSAKKLEFQECSQSVSENASNNMITEVRQMPARSSRSGGGRVPAWFKQ